MELIRNMQTLESKFRDKYAIRVFRALFRRFGMNVTVIRRNVISSASIFNPPTEAGDLSAAALNVFGDFSGVSPAKANPVLDEDDTEDVEFQARIVIAKVPNTPFDAASTGMLEQQIIYTADDLQPQDLVIISSEDGTIKRGLVGQNLQWGLADSVYKTFEFNNYGGGTSEI